MATSLHQGDDTRTIATVKGVAKLDGGGVLAVSKHGIAEFYVNDTYIGTVENHDALSANVGLLFYDRGTFAAPV